MLFGWAPFDQNMFYQEKKIFDFEAIMTVYKKQKVMEDSLKLDGLSKKEIKKQIKLANEENGYIYINRKIYEDVKACKEAVDFMNEIDIYSDLELLSKEKIKLLKEYRNAFVSDSKETIKPIQKTLKLVDKSKSK